MSWAEELIQDRSGLMPPASRVAIEQIESRLGVRFPAEYVEFLTWADGGLLPGKTLLLYSVGPGLHPDETLLASNEGREPDFPILAIGRDAYEEFGFLKTDLTGPEVPAAPPIYWYLHETRETQQAGESLADFLRRALRQA